MQKIRIAIVGCGKIGWKRAESIRRDHTADLVTAVDTNASAAQKLASAFKCGWGTDWKKAVRSPGIDAVIVSTPTDQLSRISIEALKHGKHVLMEKPMGKNLKEALLTAKAAHQSEKILQVGFNHRYHPAMQETKKLLDKGAIGGPINVRCAYGHGGRAGYEKEWRTQYKISGGGEMLDQGVHLIDLVQWYFGRPSQVFAFMQTAFWKIRPSEDNGFALIKYNNGLTASLHASWTEWKNLFRMEIFGTKGFITIEGLGGSYGEETLTVGLREKLGAAPVLTKKVYEGKDGSWDLEWRNFSGLIRGKKDAETNLDESVEVMRTLDGLYRSEKSSKALKV